MPTTSKSVFEKNLVRTRYFTAIHQEQQEGAGAPTLQYRELPRAAIVFAVGSLDSYLSEVIVAQLQTALANDNIRSVLKNVQKEIPTLALELSILGTRKERVEKLQDSIADHFHSKVSNHGSKAVSATMTRIGGAVADIWSTLISDGHKTPANYLDKWTQHRHDIVHKGAKPPIHRPHAENFIDFTEMLVNRIDSFAEIAKTSG